MNADSLIVYTYVNHNAWNKLVAKVTRSDFYTFMSEV